MAMKGSAFAQLFHILRFKQLFLYVRVLLALQSAARLCATLSNLWTKSRALVLSGTKTLSLAIRQDTENTCIPLALGMTGGACGAGGECESWTGSYRANGLRSQRVCYLSTRLTGQSPSDSGLLVGNANYLAAPFGRQ